MSNIINDHLQKLDLLIPAKISLPYQATDIVRRQKVYNLLQGCFSHRFTLVRAPAGYGKTTVVSHWAAHLTTPVAWLSLTKEDNQLSVFLAYLSAALKKANPTFDCNFEDTLYNEDKNQLRSLELRLLYEIDKIAPATILALDDYHIIQNPKIHKLLYFLLQNSTNWALPNATDHGCHVILLSRSDLPFFISKWRIHQEVNEIGVDELKFSKEEITEFLSANHTAHLRPELIELIARQTEGWVTGLRLALLELKTQDQYSIKNNPGFLANNHLLIQYMMEEVLQDLPEDVYSFLLITSITDHFTAELCNSICDRQDSQKVIDWLIHENLFVLPMDDQSGWFRYHQLLLDVLIHQQPGLGAETLQKYHNRAARWLENNGFIRASLSHWLAAENPDDAARMLVDNTFQLLSTYTPLFLREMIEAIPEVCFSTNPWLCISHVWSCARQMEAPYDHRLHQVMKYIESTNTITKLSDEEIRKIKGNIYTLRALYEARFGECQDTVNFATQALELLPIEEAGIRGFDLIAIARIYFRNGQFDECLQSLREARTMFENGGNLTGTSEAIFSIGNVLYSKGELNAAHQIFQEVITLSTSPNWKEKYFFNLSFYCLSMIELEWNQNKKAKEYLSRNCSIGWIGASASTKILVDHLSLATKLNFLDEAKKIVKIVESHLEHHKLSKMMRPYLVSSLLDFYCQQNDFFKAKQIIDKAGIEFIIPGNFLDEALLISLAYYYWKTSQFLKAKQLLEQLFPFLTQGERFDRLIKARTLYAVVLHDSGEIQEAACQLSIALDYGLREGYFETFVSFGKPILELINTISREAYPSECSAIDLTKLKSISDAISQTIVKGQYQRNLATESSSFRRISRDSLGNSFTPKEKTILFYLSSESDQKVIANELHISITTMKTHVSHIYAKLGVHSRIEAVTKAKRLGFIKP